jgi:hypothetical protein
VAARTIDAPGRPERSFVTTEEAAEWLGVGTSTFLRLVGRKTGGAALPGVAEWMRPAGHGDKLLWDWADVFALRQILMKRQAPDDPGDDEGDEKS